MQTEYKLIGTQFVKRLSDSLTIPLVEGNTDYTLYKQWLEEGNTPEPEFSKEELAKQELSKKVADAMYLLESTQFKFGEDYDLKDTPEWLELKSQRQAAREFIRLNS